MLKIKVTILLQFSFIRKVNGMLTEVLGALRADCMSFTVYCSCVCFRYELNVKQFPFVEIYCWKELNIVQIIIYISVIH